MFFGRRMAVLAAALAMAASAAPLRAQPAGNTDAQQNVKESQQYEQLLCSNPKFRATRIEKECGSLKGSDFYQNCVASFDCKKGPTAVDPKGLPASEKVR